MDVCTFIGRSFSTLQAAPFFALATKKSLSAFFIPVLSNQHQNTAQSLAASRLEQGVVKHRLPGLAVQNVCEQVTTPHSPHSHVHRYFQCETTAVVHVTVTRRFCGFGHGIDNVKDAAVEVVAWG